MLLSEFQKIQEIDQKLNELMMLRIKLFNMPDPLPKKQQLDINMQTASTHNLTFRPRYQDVTSQRSTAPGALSITKPFYSSRKLAAHSSTTTRRISSRLQNRNSLDSILK